MKFTPKTEEEIALSNLFPEGNYGFEIMNAEDKVSKAGNDMIVLHVKIFNEEGRERTLFDYLLESLDYKLRHAAEVCGLLHRYEQGDLLAHEFVGKTGNLKLKQRKNKERDTMENVIQDYIVHKPEGRDGDGVAGGATVKGPPSGHPASASMTAEPMPWD